MPKRFKHAGRPQQCRKICQLPGRKFFKPAGISLDDLNAHVLSLDELEAMRLVDLEGLYHQDAAEQMGISRATLGRILENARRTVVQTLVDGAALHIKGGSVDIQTTTNKEN